jgi:opacity protein-like surface antigen
MLLKRAIFGAIGLLFSAGAASAQWSGCGLGVAGSIWDGNVGTAPLYLSAAGQKAGISVDCNQKYQAFIFGAEIGYDWHFGDSKDLGFENELFVIGKVGVLVSPASQLYALAGWGQLTHSSFKVDGWKMGIGNEFRVPNSPMYLDLRYTYTDWDASDAGAPATIDANSHEFRLGVKFRFGPGMFGNSGSIFADTEPEPKAVGGDKKLMR